MVTRRLALLLVLAALLAPAAHAALPAVPALPPAADPVQARERAEDVYAAATGERLDREEVDVRMDMEFRDVGFDAFGMVFGGGSFRADARLTTRLDFHVISVGRVQDALEEASGTPVDPSEHGLDARRQHLSADAFRATLAGQALAAFQQEQEARVTRLVTESFPEVTVLGSYFAWANTSVSDSRRGDPLPGLARPAPGHDARNPPVTLVSVLELQYARRVSLVSWLEDAWTRDPAERAEESLRERLEAEARGAAHERSLFGVYGLPQLIQVRAPPGWDVRLTLRLPEGYTFEEASPEVRVDDALRSATTAAYARDSDAPVTSAAAVTLGSRTHVAFLLLGVVLVAGAALRVPAILLANRLLFPRARRAPPPAQASGAASPPGGP